MRNPAAGRVLALDGIRAMAAFSVLVAHFFPRDTALWRGFQFGRFGVGVFFVLSGSLIVDLLLLGRQKIEHGERPVAIWLAFYLRRLLRIGPLYYGIILFFALIGYAPVYDALWWHITYTSNFGYSLFGLQFGNLSHFWSLCVEEQFYLFLPIIILGLNSRRSFALLSCVFLLCFGFKVWAAVATHSPVLLSRLPVTNIEGFALGALIAYSGRLSAGARIWRLSTRWLKIPALAGAALLSYCRYSLGDEVYQTAAYLCLPDICFALSVAPLVASLLAGGRTDPLTRLLESRCLVYLGTISYGTYAFHFAMTPFFAKILGPLGVDDQTYLAFVVKCSVTYAMASVSWHAFEHPLLRLREKLKWSRRAPFASEGVQPVDVYRRHIAA